MVLAADAELVGADSENRMLHAMPASGVDKRAEFQLMTVPVPATVVRTYLTDYEDDVVARLLTRYSGKDVIDGWRDGPESNGIKVVYGRVEGNSWYTMCASGKLKVSADKAAKVLVAPDMAPHYDEMTKEVRVIEKLSEHTEMRIASCKSVMFTSPRDFSVTTTVRREPSGRVAIATRSVDQPHRHGYTRALSHISGYVITPDPADPNVCELAVIAHMDLGGHMPAVVINYLGLSAPIKTVEKIREVVVAAHV